MHLGVRVRREGQENAIEVRDPLSDCARDRLENALVPVTGAAPTARAPNAIQAAPSGRRGDGRAHAAIRPDERRSQRERDHERGLPRSGRGDFDPQPRDRDGERRQSAGDERSPPMHPRLPPREVRRAPRQGRRRDARRRRECRAERAGAGPEECASAGRHSSARRSRRPREGAAWPERARRRPRAGSRFAVTTTSSPAWAVRVCSCTSQRASLVRASGSAAARTPSMVRKSSTSDDTWTTAPPTPVVTRAAFRPRPAYTLRTDPAARTASSKLESPRLAACPGGIAVEEHHDRVARTCLRAPSPSAARDARSSASARAAGTRPACTRGPSGSRSRPAGAGAVGALLRPAARRR